MNPTILSTPIRIERRPWGFFSVYLEQRVPSASWVSQFVSELQTSYDPKGPLVEHLSGGPMTVKIIHVYARSRLSLQFHRNRSEEWYCLSGRAYAVLKRGGRLDKTPIEKDDRVIVPRMTVHRLGCEEESADILEVSRGDFDEGDIVRLEDDYRVVS